MKYAKMLGLAAIAAMALMAVIGAGTASAKVCSTSGKGASCGGSHGSVYTGNVVAKLTEGKTATLTSGFITVKCSSSEAAGEITNGETGTGNISKLAFSSCTSGLGACTASTTASSSNKWPATVAVTTAPNGKMTVTGVKGEFTCAGVTCIYAAESATAEVRGSDTAPEIVATSVPLTKQAGSNALCSSTATWSGEYLISTPSSIFIT